MAKNNNGQPEVSLSLFAKRVRQFKRIKRGFYALIFILTLYVISFFNPYIFNNRALIMRYEGKTCYPVSMGKKVILEQDLGREGYGEADYLTIQKEIAEKKKVDPSVSDFVFMPLVPYSWNGRDRNEYHGMRLKEDTGVLGVELLAPPNAPRQFHLVDPERVETMLQDPAIVKKYGVKPDWLHSALFDKEWTRDLLADTAGTQVILNNLPLVSKILANRTQIRGILDNSEWAQRLVDEPDWAMSILDDYRELKNETGHSENVQRILDDPRLARGILSDTETVRKVLANPVIARTIVENPEKHRKIQNNTDTVRKALMEPHWILGLLDDESSTNIDIDQAKAARDAFLEGEGVLTSRIPHALGTDKTGRDVLVRLAYGFRISITFALLVLCCTYTFGCALGAAMGYYAGKFDIIVQRLVEIWSSMPFLYTIIIISSLIRPNFYMLIFVLGIFRWIGLTYYMRGEFYKEKRKDYVIAAVATGANDRQIIFQHILPNSLTPIISFAPFAIVGYIFLLVGLDFLGFGLPPPTPSWGEMVGKGLENVKNWWLVLCPLAAMFFTLLSVVFIGEAVREAFDPRAHQRLR